jgi:hypothetical protein
VAPAPETAPEEELVRAIAAVIPVLVAERVEAELIVSAAGMFRVAAAGIGMPSVEVPGDTTDRVRVAAAVAAPPALGHVAAEASVVGAVGEDRRVQSQQEIRGTLI